MSVYTVVTEIPATEIYTTVAASPTEAEQNVIDVVGDDEINPDSVNAVATLEGLQMFAEDGENQTAKMRLGE